MPFTNSMQDPEAGQRHLYTDEKSISQLTVASSTSSTSPARRRCSVKMPQFRSCLITIVVAAFLTFAYASAIHHRQSSPEVRQVASQPDVTRFEQLLSEVSDKSLHDVLHKYVTLKYKHGVYPEDRKAVEAIHHDNPAAGTSLVELARRQGNGTVVATTSIAPETTTAVVVPSTTATETETPASITPTETSPAQQPTTTAKTTVVPASTTAPSSQGTTSHGTTSTPASSRQAASSTTSINTSVFVSAEGGTTDATTTRAASTTASVKSQQVIYTTTLPDGARSTVTYVTVIPADSQASTPGVTATGVPGLQSGAERRELGGWTLGMGAFGAFLMAL